MQFRSTCLACHAELPVGAEVKGRVFGGHWYFLCMDCWDKVSRPGRKFRQVMESILYFYDLDSGNPDFELDRENNRDLELLGFLTW